jgi:hypothetical protein
MAGIEMTGNRATAAPRGVTLATAAGTIQGGLPLGPLQEDEQVLVPFTEHNVVASGAWVFRRDGSVVRRPDAV